MKVLLLTDSVSLPRKYEGGTVLWEDIYCSRLKKKFPDVEFVLLAMGGSTITEIELALNYYTQVNPDMIILQSGIVDCAPRALGQLEQQIIMKLHLFRLVHPLTKFMRKYRNISYTNPKIFEKTLLKIKNTFPEKPFISIGILPGCEAYNIKVPGVSEKIIEYNNILAKQTIFIDNTDFPREGIISDFHHMNEIGHHVIFKKLLPLIEKYKTSLND
ncbi:MAG: SGNH/GDSL hydrolase family protein [Ferruginibacter sp.]